MLNKYAALLPAGLLILSTLACGLVDDVRNVVETVDDAAKLLQEIDKSGTWDAIANGLDALAKQDQGYLATIALKEGATNAAGAYEGALDQDVTITLQVDGQNDALAQVVTNGETRDFFIDTSAGEQGDTQVYRIENGQYTCVSDSDEGRLLRDGVSGAFEEYSIEAIGVHLLSVTNKVGDETLAGRPATHYELVSKVPEALEILKKLDSKDLQAKIDEAGTFDLSGDLYLDQQSDAILRFDSVYSQIDQQRRMEFSFAVTQWGGVQDIPEPTTDQIAGACTS